MSVVLCECVSAIYVYIHEQIYIDNPKTKKKHQLMCVKTVEWEMNFFFVYVASEHAF